MSEGRKDDTGKPRWSLLPEGAVSNIVAVLEAGARKYSENNWQLVPDGKTRYYDAAMRHLEAWRNGELNDPETGLPHLAHAGCCLMFLGWLDGQCAPKKLVVNQDMPLQIFKRLDTEGQKEHITREPQWIEWSGECPIHPDTWIEMRTQFGQSVGYAKEFVWTGRNKYRVISEAENDWIEWTGSVKAPVGLNIYVDVMYRSGVEQLNNPAGVIRWNHTIRPDDVIKYRVSEGQK